MLRMEVVETGFPDVLGILFIQKKLPFKCSMLYSAVYDRQPTNVVLSNLSLKPCFIKGLSNIYTIRNNKKSFFVLIFPNLTRKWPIYKDLPNTSEYKWLSLRAPGGRS